MSWKDALVLYAKTEDPSKIPSDVLLLHNETTLTIWDKYPKAKYHFLCLPRLPLAAPKDSTSEISQATLNNLASLLANKHGLHVLKLLKEASLEVVETIEEEMVKQEGFKWSISVGFHAIESMSHVHLHIISQDFVSDSLKNKKHWNSFNPSHGFFLHLDELLEWVEAGTLKQHNKTKAAYEKLLTDQLTCFRCDEAFATMPKLKEHLQQHFQQLSSQASIAGTSKRAREDTDGPRKKSKSGE